MKIIFILLCSFQISTFAELACSQNGAELIYINGILTSKIKGQENWNAVMRSLNFKSGSQEDKYFNKELDNNIVTEKFLHNPTYGFLNDTAEMFSQMYYAKYGTTKDAYQYFYIMNNLPDEALGVAGMMMPNPALKAMGLLGISKPINFISMNILAEEGVKNAFLNTLLSKSDLLVAKENVVNEVSEHLKGLKNQKKKAIVIVHSQGNAVLSAAVKKFAYSDNANRRYLTDHFGFYQVGNPIAPLNELQDYMPNNEQRDFISRYVLNSSDLVIKGANGLNFIVSNMLNIPLPNSLPNYSVVSSLPSSASEGSTDSDPLFHGISEIYTNPSIRFRKIDGDGSIIRASDLAKENLREIASKLKSNCSPPKPVITYDQDPRTMYVGNGAKVVFSAKDSLPYEDQPDKKEPFKSIEWEINGFHEVEPENNIYLVTTWSTSRGGRKVIRGEGETFSFDLHIAAEYVLKLTVERLDGVRTTHEFKFTTKDREPKLGAFEPPVCEYFPLNGNEIHHGYISDHDSMEYGYYFSEDPNEVAPNRILAGDSNYIRDDLRTYFSFGYGFTPNDGKTLPIRNHTIYIYKINKYVSNSVPVFMGTLSIPINSCDRD